MAPRWSSQPSGAVCENSEKFFFVPGVHGVEPRGLGSLRLEGMEEEALMRGVSMKKAVLLVVSPCSRPCVSPCTPPRGTTDERERGPRFEVQGPGQRREAGTITPGTRGVKSTAPTRAQNPGVRGRNRRPDDARDAHAACRLGVPAREERRRGEGERGRPPGGCSARSGLREGATTEASRTRLTRARVTRSHRSQLRKPGTKAVLCGWQPPSAGSGAPRTPRPRRRPGRSRRRLPTQRLRRYDRDPTDRRRPTPLRGPARFQREINRPGSGLYKSTDGGDNW